jgi:geranylgeranyl diphosphate synthase type I
MGAVTEQSFVEAGSAMDGDLPGQVRDTLATYLEARIAECETLDPEITKAAETLARFVLDSGKRIRPTFAWWGWRAAGGPGEGPEAEAVLRAAAALELVHTSALVHDDLIDDSDTRRGKPAVHREFATRHSNARWDGDAKHFGMAAAILLGDLALTWSDDMFHSAGLAPDALARGLRPWRSMRTEVLAGQYLDVLGQVRKSPTVHSALRVNELKSASYTVQRPLELGAEIADSSSPTLEALRRFGSDIGVAFQLRDDLLGVFGDPAVTGKPAGDDLREGKRTVLIAEAFDATHQHGDHRAADLLSSVLGDQTVDDSRVEQVREMLRCLGAVTAVERRIAALTDSALEALTDGCLAEPAVTHLRELAVAVTERTR